MTEKEKEKLWNEQGECRSCGWHNALYEVDDEFWDELEEKGKVWLPCGNPDNGGGHRGVTLYLY